MVVPLGTCPASLASCPCKARPLRFLFGKHLKTQAKREVEKREGQTDPGKLLELQQDFLILPDRCRWQSSPAPQRPAQPSSLMNCNACWQGVKG